MNDKPQDMTQADWTRITVSLDKHLDTRFDGLTRRIGLLESTQAQVEASLLSLELTRAALDGKASRSAMWVTQILAALAVLLSLAALVVKAG